MPLHLMCSASPSSSEARLPYLVGICPALSSLAQPLLVAISSVGQASLTALVALTALMVRATSGVMTALVVRHLVGSKSRMMLAYVGIGRETVRALAAAGAKVIMTSRDLAAGQKVATELIQGKVMVTLPSLPPPPPCLPLCFPSPLVLLATNHLACLFGLRDVLRGIRAQSLPTYAVQDALSSDATYN